MNYLQKINELIAQNCISEAINLLTEIIEKTPGDELYFMRGKLFWRMGEPRKAINDYNVALSLNSDSPARVALEQANKILDFYNTDLYNP